MGMSKIERFKEAKSVADRIQRSVLQCTGRDKPDNDKHRISVNFTKLVDSDWVPMEFQIHASHGYYGSSSAYSDTSKELGSYLARAIKQKSHELFDLAASLARADAETARKEAEEEARNVLTEASPTAA
jgi:hypothetical protein